MTELTCRRLIERAKVTGRLHHDFVHQDLVLVLMASVGVVNGTGRTVPMHGDGS